jgi:hypothetical protein
VQIAASNGVEDFVSRLHDLWKQPRREDEDPGSRSRLVPPTPGTPYVFLSYASEDHRLAMTIKDALEEKQVHVLSDQDDREEADLSNPVIEERIRNCQVFLPCISEKTNATKHRIDGVFEKWNMALEHGRQTPGVQTYIQPVILDDVPREAAPPPFRGMDTYRLKDGAPPLVARIRKRLEQVKS